MRGRVPLGPVVCAVVVFRSRIQTPFRIRFGRIRVCKFGSSCFYKVPVKTLAGAAFLLRFCRGLSLLHSRCRESTAAMTTSLTSLSGSVLVL
jgi:hypothetical protein